MLGGYQDKEIQLGCLAPLPMKWPHLQHLPYSSDSLMQDTFSISRIYSPMSEQPFFPEVAWYSKVQLLQSTGVTNDSH